MAITHPELETVAVLLARSDWQAAHRIVQQDEDSPLACWAHGIVHLMEGDVANARYWYRRAGRPFPGAGACTDEIAALREALQR
jgi:hypothetical protein